MNTKSTLSVTDHDPFTFMLTLIHTQSCTAQLMSFKPGESMSDCMLHSPEISASTAWLPVT